MPPVPVTDLTVHAREKDLVVGTYGRGAWVMDVSPFRELADSLLTKDFYLFDIQTKPVANYSERSHWGNYHMTGDNHLRTPNEPGGLEVYYHLGTVDSRDKVYLRMTDESGKETDFEVPKTPGLHREYLQMRRMSPGSYKVSLLVGKNRVTKSARITPAPSWPVGNITPGTAH
jgi:hypothetical protein